MSRIGKAPILIPDGVTVTIEPARVAVVGPLGSLQQQVPPRMKIEQADGVVTVTRPTERGEDRALHGLTRTLVANMVQGVTKGFEKKLEIQGVGYRARSRAPTSSSTSATRTPSRSSRAPASRSRCRRRPRSSSRESTSRWSARRPPRSARCARPSRTRARASATRASTSAGRSASVPSLTVSEARLAAPSPRPRAR